MVNPTNYELKFIAKNRGIKNYQNMSREELLSTLDKSEHITENLLKNGLERIARVQNLSLNELEQITEMNNLLKNKLEQITKNRHIKNYRNMLKEDLLIAFLKSNQSHAELWKSEDSNLEIGETKKLFNELRNNFSKKERNKIRRKFRLKESIDEYLKELEQKDTLTEKEKQEKKRYTKRLPKVEEFFKKLKENLNRLERYQYNNNEDLDYKGIRQIENLFDKIDEDYYKPIRTKGAFNDDYVEYESRGDKDKNLTPEDYLDIIRPFLRDIINNHKTHGEWKIQLTMQITFISSLDIGEFHIMHLKSNNVEIMMGAETDDIINELFESFFKKY